MSTQHNAFRDGINTLWTEYTDEELRAAWETNDQGHRQAVERGPTCVVVICDVFDAVSISRLFVRNIFAVPTCCHYDGTTLSLYCGDAGGGWRDTYRSAQTLTLFWQVAP